MTPRIARRFAAAFLVLALLGVAFARVAAADEPPAAPASPEAPATKPLGVDEVEEAFTRRPAAFVTIVLFRYGVSVAGIVVLILAASRRNAQRKGLLPPPPPPVPPRAPLPPLFALALVGGLFVAGYALVTVPSTVGWTPTLAYVLVASVLPGVIAAVFAVRQRRRIAAAAPRTRTPLSTALAEGLKAYAVGTLLSTAAALAWTPILKALGKPLEVQRAVQLLMQGSPTDAALLVVLAVVVAPLWEESVFRGVLYSGVRTVTTRTAAVVFSAAVFAGIHQSLVAFLPLFALAVVLARAFEKTDHLATPIAAHLLFNASGVLPILLVRGG